MPASARNWPVSAGGVLSVVLLVLSLAILPLLSATINPPHNVSSAWYGALAIFFGELVGFSEITSRYRDEPLRATFNRYGSMYLVLNGCISGCAYWILRNYGAAIFPKAQDPPLLAAVVAGFGAMAVLRSKFFNFRTDDGKEIAIGPDLVISSMLRVVDRKIDRIRAATRQQLVFEMAKLVSAAMESAADFEDPNSFVVISLASFQNLSTEEKQQIVSKSDALTKELKTKPSLFKAMVLGFMVLDIAGEDNFRDIMKDLEEYLKSTATPKHPGSSAVTSGPSMQPRS